jgi:hypothetical protein
MDERVRYWARFMKHFQKNEYLENIVLAQTPSCKHTFFMEKVR